MNSDFFVVVLSYSAVYLAIAGYAVYLGGKGKKLASDLEEVRRLLSRKDSES